MLKFVWLDSFDGLSLEPGILGGGFDLDLLACVVLRSLILLDRLSLVGLEGGILQHNDRIKSYPDELYLWNSNTNY